VKLIDQLWKHDRNGHTLLAAAIAAGILSILVGSYLGWITNEYLLSQRSHSWTQALYLAEAGVEVGVAELSHVYRKNPNQAFHTANGWSTTTNGFSKVINNFIDATGRNIGNIDITVEAVGSEYPSVTATGTAWSRGASTSIVRRVRTRLRRNQSLPYGLIVKNKLELSSNNKINVDSFDSSDPSKSTNGLYDPLKRTAQVAIASASGDIELKNVDVYGTAQTAPGKTVEFNSSSSSIGTTFVTADRSTSEVDAELKGWITHDAAMTLSDVVLPAEFASAPNLGDIDGGQVLNSGAYRVTSLKNSSGNIVINGNVRIYCSQNVTLSGQSAITINTGAALEVYVAGNVTISGKGVANPVGLAEQNAWYGLNTSGNWDLGGDAGFVGTVYAPNSSISLKGSPTYIGAFVGDSMEMGGDTNIHFDEALRAGIGNNAYTFLTWEPLVYRGWNCVLETN